MITIIDWLDYFNAEYKLINESQTQFSFQSIEISNTQVNLNLSDIKFTRFLIYWNRRSLPITFDFQKQSTNDIEKCEFRTITTFANDLIEERSVNKFRDNFTNKLFNLYSARNLGLIIPNSLITDNLMEVLNFYARNNNRIVNKAIDTVSLYPYQQYSRYTALVKENDLLNLENSFQPSLFQELVEKKYEIRSFYYYGKFYSMAIFSQADEQTEIDYRKYRYEKPNRCVPYNLPCEIEQKLDSLMKKLLLNTGSIDLIYSLNDEYYFLEINPVGMFSSLTWPLNYSIEKDIAIHLIREAENHEN